MGDGVHYGSTNIAKYVVHPESKCRIEVNNFTDEFSMGVGPMVDGLEDVSCNRGVWLEG